VRCELQRVNIERTDLTKIPPRSSNQVTFLYSTARKTRRETCFLTMAIRSGFVLEFPKRKPNILIKFTSETCFESKGSLCAVSCFVGLALCGL